MLDGIYGALNGDGSFFVDGPPTVEDDVAMPLLCNDYSESFTLTYSKERNLHDVDFERTFEAFQKSLQTGLEVIRTSNLCDHH